MIRYFKHMHGENERAQATAGTRRAGGAVVHAVLLTAAVLAVLSPALRAEFVWDDVQQIQRSTAIRSLASIPGYFGVNVWEAVGYDEPAAEGVETYRPLFLSALAVEYAIAGGPRPWVFHLLSVLAHAAVTLLLWGLARRWLGQPWAALAVAVLFAWHPVTAEAYLFASAIGDPLAALAVLGVVWLLDRGAAGGRTAAARWAAAGAAGGVLLAGLLVKEVIALAMPAVALWLVLRRGVRWRQLAPLAMAVALFALMRTVALGGGGAGAGGREGLALALRHLPLLLADGARALATMWPVGYRELYLEYTRLGTAWSVGAIALLVILAAIGWMARRRAPLVLLALGVGVGSLAPVALVTTVDGWGGFGRYLYLTWAFGALGAVQLGMGVLARAGRRRVWVIAAAAGVALLALQQLGLRHALWAYRDAETLAAGAVLAAPGVGTGSMRLGDARLAAGDAAGAVEPYRDAIARGRDFPTVRLGLAEALVGAGRPAEALVEVRALQASMGGGPRIAAVEIDALLALDRRDEAVAVLDVALHRAPDDPDLQRRRRAVYGGVAPRSP